MTADTQKSLSRRQFLKLSSLTGGALAVGIFVPAFGDPRIVNASDPATGDIELNAWVLINTDGRVTIMSHRAEMGQGVYQAIPQIVAEELEVDLDKVNIEFAKGDQKKYGSQITGGSSTVRGSYKKLLEMGATAREMLIIAAAAKWDVAKDTCYAQAGHVIHKPSGKKFHYGQVVIEASKLEPPKGVKLKPRSEYKLIGKPLRRQDTSLKSNGSAIFGLDKRLPELMFAAVERNPRLRGTVKSFDDREAKKIPGVKKVFKVKMRVFDGDREGVAVVANSTWAAIRGKRALKVEWDDSGFEHVGTDEIYAKHEELLKNEDGISFKTQGDVNTILQQASDKIDVTYQTPYESHSCMEPLNCVAHYQTDKIEIWGPIQAPDWVQDVISKEFSIDRDKVVVHMTFLGGGFGRKAFMDYPHEATAISKEIGGPVQVVWTREDDMTQGPYRPGISYRCEGLVKDGAIEAFKVKLAGQNIGHMRSPERGKPNGSSSEGFLKPYYDTIQNLSIRDIPFETPIPIMWWRSVYASTNGFAYESFMDELAHAAGKDPLEFRKAHLKDARLHRQIDKLKEVSGWDKRKSNEGFGVAMTECFASTVGQVVKVSKNLEGKIKIDHVWAVMDCGWYVNPDTIKAQVEGSIVMALGAATIHEITFKDGMTEQRNFYDYKMPRVTDIPHIDVYVMDNDEPAGGVGEPGLPAFTPALTNAIFDLTGKRIRKLPFDLGMV